MTKRTEEDLLYLIALLNTSDSKISHFELRTLIGELGSLSNVWESQRENSLFLDELRKSELSNAERLLDQWTQKGYLVTSYLDDRYPEQLRSIHEMPLIIWTRGNLMPDPLAVSVVGTRSPDSWALKYVDDLVNGLATHNVTIVSGLALGIDSRAHQAAIANNLRTVAVLGNGLDTYYPSSNSQLQERIADQGLLLSQFKPEFAPTKYSFPIRNATMSGYSSVSVIIQAGEQSGTRIQGRVAVGHGRSVVLTSQVAATQWGSTLKEHPGVFVASNVDEAIDLASKYSRRIPDALSALLPQLA